VQVEEGSTLETGGKRARPRAIDWIFTVPFLLAFGLVLLVFDPFQRVARLFGQRPQEIVAGALQAVLIQTFRLSGMRLQVERSPEVRANTPYIIISNHQSMFDVPIFGGLLFTNYPKYVSKRSLGRWIPSISYNLRRGGNALIDREDREQAQAEIRSLGERAERRGVSVVIYPEGTRSRDGELRPFKPGGTMTLLKAAPGLAVVPAAIDGSWRLLRYNLLPVPFGVTVRVRFSDPILRISGEDAASLLAQAQAEISATLERWRSSAKNRD
jgi:1-acyl-sn-glycerol-3-phosphate acyltransferase